MHCFFFYLLGVGCWGWQTRVFSLWWDISASSEQGKYLLPESTSDPALCKGGYWPSVMWFVSGDGAMLVFIVSKGSPLLTSERMLSAMILVGCTRGSLCRNACPVCKWCLHSRFLSWHPPSQWPEDLSEILIANDFTPVHVTRDAILMTMFVYRTWERGMEVRWLYSLLMLKKSYIHLPFATVSCLYLFSHWVGKLNCLL